MGRVPNLWFGDAGEHQAVPGQRFHAEVYVAPEVAGQRVAAAGADLVVIREVGVRQGHLNEPDP